MLACGSVAPLMLGVVLSTVLTSVAEAEETAGDSGGSRFFMEKIEPLLRSRCFGCHSHAAGEMEGGLTLDSPSGWRQGGDRGTAVVAGRPNESLLIKAVRQADSELQMPPDDQLTRDEINLLVEWVERGAPDPRAHAAPPKTESAPLDWWSLRPLSSASVPVLADSPTSRNPIDAYLLQRLKLADIRPLGVADRRTLIRRASFDLHGLPPTPGQVAAFVDDPDPRAYEKLIDRLLASPRYGERWARHWLDAVHFADSHGCEHDVFRPHAWRYRDYVIDSFNRDTPWGRFVREQLASDWFYPDEPRLTPALGFIAAGPLELSRAGTAPVTFDYLDRDDMVTQTMAAFTSATVNCARCHDHKFDPVSQEDYYALQAVFAGIGKGDVEYDSDPKVAAARKRWTDLRDLANRNDPEELLAANHADLVLDWERKFGHSVASWDELVPEKFESAEGATLSLQEDHSVLASGHRPDKDITTITLPLKAGRLTAIRLDVLSDPSLPMNGPGRQDNGNLHLNEVQAFLVDEAANQTQLLKIRRASADWNQAGWTIEHAFDGNEATAWGIYPQVGKSHLAVFELAKPQSLQVGSRLVVVLKQLHGGGHLIGRAKLYATGAAEPSAELAPASVREAMRVTPEQRSREQCAAIASYALRETAEKQLAGLPPRQVVYAVSRSYSHARKLDKPMDAPKVVHVLRRGDIEKPGEVAAPGTLALIDALPSRFTVPERDEAARRAALADWIVAKDNPLTWRSIVNRVWSKHFGRGILRDSQRSRPYGRCPKSSRTARWVGGLVSRGCRRFAKEIASPDPVVGCLASPVSCVGRKRGRREK